MAACASLDLLADEQLPLVVASPCQGLIRALCQVKPLKGHPEVYDTEHELYSHPLDALRYLLVNHVLGPNLQEVSWNANEPSSLLTRQQAGQRSLMMSKW